MVQGKIVNSEPRFLLDTVAKDAGTVSLDSYSPSVGTLFSAPFTMVLTGIRNLRGQSPRQSRTVNYGRHSGCKGNESPAREINWCTSPFRLSHILSLIFQRRKFDITVR